MVFLVIMEKKLSSHMDQIREHISSSILNKSCDQMRRMVVNLCSNKFENNENSSLQLTHIHNSLLIIIVDNPEKYLSNIGEKYDMRKVCTSFVNSSSTLFSCSICTIYNGINCDQKQRLMLKSYIPGIESFIFPKRHYENFFLKR